jgi:tetratricopeptide (TPR) repeat protein
LFHAFFNGLLVDVRADVYSFGVMLYQMVSGRLPFNASSSEELARLHQTQAPTRLGCETQLWRVIERCLAEDSGRRYAEFAELRSELGALYRKTTGEEARSPKTADALSAADLNNKGAALATPGRTQKALVCYDRALELNPQLADTWANKGVALGTLGRPEEALVCFDRALEFNSQHANAWTHMGVALAALGHNKEALVCHDSAPEINPQLAEARYNKALALTQLGKYDEAFGVAKWIRDSGDPGASRLVGLLHQMRQS